MSVISAVSNQLQGIKKEQRVKSNGKQVKEAPSAGAGGGPGSQNGGPAGPPPAGDGAPSGQNGQAEGKAEQGKEQRTDNTTKDEIDASAQVEDDRPIEGEIIDASGEGYVQLDRNKKFFPCMTYVVLCDPPTRNGRPFKKLVFTTYHQAFCTMAIVPCEGMYVLNGRGYFELSFPGEVQSQIQYRQVKRQLKKEATADFASSGMALLPQMWLGLGLTIGVLETMKQKAKGKDTREPLHVVRTNLDGLDGVDPHQVRSSIFVRPTARFHFFELERLLLHAALPPGDPEAARHADDLSMEADVHFAGNPTETSWMHRRDQEENNAEFCRTQEDYFTGAGPKPFGWQDSEMLCCFPVQHREIRRTAINARLINSVFSRGMGGGQES